VPGRERAVVADQDHREPHLSGFERPTAAAIAGNPLDGASRAADDGDDDRRGEPDLGEDAAGGQLSMPSSPLPDDKSQPRDWTNSPGALGGCLCGAVRYRASAPLRAIVACHCGQCRRWHGHHGAYTAVPVDALELLAGGGELTWYRSSAAARRGFCRVCGSSLFWQPEGRGYAAITAGTLDDTSGLRLSAHIFVADRDPYDVIVDTLPQHPQGRVVER
jgi:hypothetical protein